MASRSPSSPDPLSFFMSLSFFEHIIVSGLAICFLSQIQICLLTLIYLNGIQHLETICYGTALVDQWLRLHLPMQGVQVQFLIRELRCHMPCGQKKQNVKQKQYCKNSIEILKIVHIKKKKHLLKKKMPNTHTTAYTLLPDIKLGKNLKIYMHTQHIYFIFLII